MITIKQKGNFKKLDRFLERAKEFVKLGELDRYGREGVEALSAATPVDTGKTAKSWSYEIIREDGRARLVFSNDNIQNGVPIAIVLQYGHATNNGGWVEGVDYINPAMRKVFEQILNNIRKGVAAL